MTSYEGKAKRVTPHGAGDTVAIYYKDEATAFNGQKKEVFPGKGALNSQITELLFAYLAGRGVLTHHRGRLDERTLLAVKVAIIPLEVVVRFKVAGSLQKRTGLPYMHACEPALVELYLKDDALGDPHLADEHVRLLGLASPEEVETIKSRARHAAGALRELFAAARIDLVDLKFEFGRGPDGILLADEISPDTCRFRDMDSGEILDKDLFRLGNGDLIMGYRKLHERLVEALAKVRPAATDAPPACGAELVVTLRPGVKDPQAEAIAEALGSLGFKDVAVEGVGRRLKLAFAGRDPAKARAMAEEMCRKLLVNPNLETYELRVHAP